MVNPPIFVMVVDDAIGKPTEGWQKNMADLSGVSAKDYLISKNFPMTFAVVSNEVGYPAVTATHTPTSLVSEGRMDWDALAEIVEGTGSEICSHSANHDGTLVATIPLAIAELNNSKADIETNMAIALGAPYTVKSFVQPGAWSGQVHTKGDSFAKLDQPVWTEVRRIYGQSRAYIGGVEAGSGIRAGWMPLKHGLSYQTEFKGYTTPTTAYITGTGGDAIVDTMLRYLDNSPGMVFQAFVHSIRDRAEFVSAETKDELHADATCWKRLIDGIAARRDAGTLLIKTFAELGELPEAYGVNRIVDPAFVQQQLYLTDSTAYPYTGFISMSSNAALVNHAPYLYMRSMRILSSGVIGFTALLTSDNTELTDGDTVTIGTTVYRFKDTMAQAYDVKRHGTTADTTLENLIKAINGTGTAGVEYYAGTVAHPDVYAQVRQPNSHTVRVVARVVGTATNNTATAGDATIAKAEASTHLSWNSGSFLTDSGQYIKLNQFIAEPGKYRFTCKVTGYTGTDTVQMRVRVLDRDGVLYHDELLTPNRVTSLETNALGCWGFRTVDWIVGNPGSPYLYIELSWVGTSVLLAFAQPYVYRRDRMPITTRSSATARTTATARSAATRTAL